MQRKLAFVLAGTNHGPLIINRLDFQPVGNDSAIGVGCELLEQGSYQPAEIDMALGLLELRRRYYGAGVLAIDGGANVGVHTVEWARAMTNYGQVIAVEPQERIYYALAGNIALNNLTNACALNVALGAASVILQAPVPDYSRPANFGGLSLINKNDIGQAMTDTAPVQVLTIDDLVQGGGRCDLIKLDIEGMEPAALAGAKQTINRCHPILMVEHICCGLDVLINNLPEHYEAFRFEANIVCAHKLDKCHAHVSHLHRTFLKSNLEDKATPRQWPIKDAG